MNRSVLFILAAAACMLSLRRYRDPKIYHGETFQGEIGKSAPVIMFDRHKNVYYSSNILLTSSDSVAEYMRSYTSRTLAKKRGDSVFISFGSIVKTYTTVEGFVFGEQRRFIGLHYDTSHKVYIRGRVYPEYIEAAITDVKAGTDTTMTREKYQLYE